MPRDVFIEVKRWKNNLRLSPDKGTNGRAMAPRLGAVPAAGGLAVNRPQP